MVDQELDNRRMRFLLELRRKGISDPNVLRAIDGTPRPRFVTPETTCSAYADHALPIACGQTISQPYIVAYMTERLDVQPKHRVLEIGTGSGYQAAILSLLAREVISVERFRTLAASARERLKALGRNNVEVLFGDGTAGAPERAPFDRIIVTAACAEIPPALIEQLAPDGVLVAPVGPQEGPQHLIRFARSPSGDSRETLLAVRFVPLLPGEARQL